MVEVRSGPESWWEGEQIRGLCTRVLGSPVDESILIIRIIIIITISYMLRKVNTLAVLTSNPPIEASESKS